MIPDFPQFKSLCLADAEVITAHSRRFPPYSDYNFTSLWVWGGVNGRCEISLLHGNLVVKFTDYLTSEPFYSFLGTRHAQQTARSLLEYSAAMGLPAELHLIPQSVVEGIDRGQLSVCEDEASSDYVYLTAQISELAGGPYKNKRSVLRAFEAEHPDRGVTVLPLRDAAAQAAVRNIAQAWKAHRMLKDDAALEQPGIAQEIAALESVLDLAHTHELWVGIVTTAGTPTGFSIEELTHGSWSVSHFSKLAERRRGENEYLTRELALHLLQREITHCNWQQDLGIESLRASKLSFRPVKMLKKFSVTQTTTAEVRPSLRPLSMKPPPRW